MTVTKAVPLSSDGGVLVELSSEVVPVQLFQGEEGATASAGGAVVDPMAAVGDASLMCAQACLTASRPALATNGLTS